MILSRPFAHIPICRFSEQRSLLEYEQYKLAPADEYILLRGDWKLGFYGRTRNREEVSISDIIWNEVCGAGLESAFVYISSGVVELS